MISSKDTEMTKTGTPPGGEKRDTVKLIITILKVNILEFQMLGLAPNTLHILIHVIFTIVGTIIVPTLQMRTLGTVML